MSEPALFVLIRDGKTSFYGDRWAGAFLFREIFWGPEELEKWVTRLEQLDGWTDDFSSAVVVDVDQRKLLWTGDDGQLCIPRVAAQYDRLMRTAWPGYEIQLAVNGLPDIAKAVGISGSEDYDSEIPTRTLSIRDAAYEAAGEDDQDDDEEGDGGDDDNGDRFGDQPRAWLTLIDKSGAVRHRQLESLTEDLLESAKTVLQQAFELPDAEIPAERLVKEGMWIDQKKHEIGIWGGAGTRYYLPQVEKAWQGWTVRWAKSGYDDQCRVSGPTGMPLSDIEAVAEFLPTILSTKRFDLGNMIGAVGGELKKTATKLTGCLLGLMCFPVLLFGLISGNWKAALITIGIVVALVTVVFKIIEFRLRRSWSSKLEPLNKGRDDVPPVAGPLQETDRRRRVDELLVASGFPPLSKIESSFRKENALDLLD